jgi:cytochrome P450
MARTAVKDVEISGQLIKAGERVIVHYASANRDEEVFPHADQLDFTRPRNPHLAFGAGVHRCIGSNFARFQIAIGFEELLRRVTRIRLAEGEIRYNPGLVRAPSALPLTFEPLAP